jgi:hypothetical protein
LDFYDPIKDLWTTLRKKAAKVNWLWYTCWNVPKTCADYVPPVITWVQILELLKKRRVNVISMIQKEIAETI